MNRRRTIDWQYVLGLLPKDDRLAVCIRFAAAAFHYHWDFSAYCLHRGSHPI
jgi:hypothetical protein